MLIATSDLAAANRMVDCSKGDDLQKEIDKAASGDMITIKGVCMQNIVIAGKALTLVGDASPGPHGITGVNPNTDGVSIESSSGTHFEDLVINNPLFTGVRIRFNSFVTMTDVEISNCGGGGATGIWVQEGSGFDGTRLRLDDNLRGLGATSQSRAFCYECDLNDNASWTATSSRGSTVSLLDSEVNGARGIDALQGSYIDIDCLTHGSAHNCSLTATTVAGLSFWNSTAAFYGAGDFSGRFLALDRAKIQVLGARQQSNPGGNSIDDNSSLEVRDLAGNSRVMGHTEISGFSNALFYDASTVLDGTLNCSAAGDAWVDGGIDLGTPGYTITGCDHAP